MPHRINIDGISEKLFLLKNLGFASQPLCANFRINRIDDEHQISWPYYFGWLKAMVSEYLLDVSIKFRVLQDFLKDEDFGPEQFKQLENEAISEIVIGRFFPSQESLPIREACNKLIHAGDVRLTWIEITDSKGSYEYWNGTVVLQGMNKRQQWECEVDVINFCVAMEILLARLSTDIDWDHVYKYDE